MDLKHSDGKKIVDKLVATADVVTENFRPGALDKIGLGYKELSAKHPKLIYCTLKGFLEGPYDHRPALDEVVQMMGGLAYMTGLPDRPLRVGSSVNDIMGGMFGAIGILAALRERETTGKGKLVRSALFENTAFLVGQHMAQKAITGEEPPPMSMKKPAWGVYDIFETSDDRVFVGIVTDTQWEVFCREFKEAGLGSDARLKTNTQRVKERGWLIPRLGEVFKRWNKAGLMAKLEAIGLPFAPITKPWDLFDDPHLKASGGLAEIRDPRGHTFRTPTLPLELDGKRLPQRANPPAIGEGARELLVSLGYAPAEVEALRAKGVLVLH